ncbi:MAG: hypothetical protein NWP80_00130 [Candidatus Gracilibacteria bacterium]|nr:hypothetical protein [Candidatus Gracilibacteria bacterium]
MNPNLIVLKKGHLSFLSERKTTRENFKLGVNSTYILSLIFIAFLGIYYVWILNINATKGYNIRNLELIKNNLLVEKDMIDVRIAELESLSNIRKWEGAKTMVKANPSDFLVIKDNNRYVYNQ